jgi:hypothetical protein
MVHHAANLPVKSTARRRRGLSVAIWRVRRGKGFGAGTAFNISKEFLAAINSPLTTPLLLSYIVRG